MLEPGTVRIIPMLVVLTFGLVFTQNALAQITAIGPFNGDLVEDFESYPPVDPGVSFAVFGGVALHNQLTGYTPRIWPDNFWGLGLANGDARAADGVQGFGMNDNATGEFVFSTPITAFGAYFGTAEAGDTMFVAFYDVDNALIGAAQSWSYSRPGDGVLEWHGYDIGQEAVRVVWGSLSVTGAAPAIDSIRVLTAAPDSASTVRSVPVMPVYWLVLTIIGLLALASRKSAGHNP